MFRVEDTSIQLCRLCLRNTTGCISIFTEHFDTDDAELPKILKNCVGVRVLRDDSYTCMICGPCHKMVLRFNQFKTTCLESQWRLKHMPRWAAEGPRDPLEGCNEDKIRPIEAEGLGEDVAIDRVQGTSVVNGKIDDNGSSIWPVAVWSKSEGCWRARACSSDETVISDPLDDGGKSMAIDYRVDSIDDNSGATLSEDEDADPSLDNHMLEHPYDEHNYSIQPLSNEPLQLCSVVMEHIDDDEEDWRGGGDVIMESTEEETEVEVIGKRKSNMTPPRPLLSVVVGNKEVGIIKEFGDTSMMPSKEPDFYSSSNHPQVTGRKTQASSSILRRKIVDATVLLPSISEQQPIPSQRIPIQLKQRDILPKPIISKDFKNAIKGHIISAKLSNGQVELKDNKANLVQRIVIKKKNTSDSVKHIPLVRGLRLSSDIIIPENAQCSLLKMKRVVR